MRLARITTTSRTAQETTPLFRTRSCRGRLEVIIDTGLTALPAFGS